MGNLSKINFLDSRMNAHILASTSVRFKLKTMQVPNLALTHTKRITVFASAVILYIHCLRGASKIKVKNVNKKRMATARRLIFFGNSQGIHC